MGLLEPSDILFVGIGQSAVCWYRCALPAMHLGADWVGIHMDETDPGLHVATGLVKNDTLAPDFNDYKVVIVQQPRGRIWFKRIKGLQERGIKVLYEVDDYLHSVRKQKHHDFSKHFVKKALVGYELCMRACDGIICSTDYIARRYRQFNKHVYVCENGIDMGRYALTLPERDTVNIGWAGATGHMEAVVEWINNGLLDVLMGRDHANFVSIGQPELARGVGQIVGESRAIGIPFAMIETYPAAMCMFDIALAPAQSTGWYRGKSDLRWLEASALRIPVVASPIIYPEIEHGVTGFLAETPTEMAETLMQLVDDAQLRRRVGQEAHEYVREHREISVASLQWLDVARAAVGDYESSHELVGARS